MRSDRLPARAFALATFALAALPPAPRAQDPAPAAAPAAAARIPWEGDFDAALARAQKEGKPVFVAFLMDDEPANDQTIEKNYTDADIVKLAGKCVCLPCCIGEHKGDDGMCKKFKGITCAQHQELEKKARARWLIGTEVCAPQHVFCDPKGEVLLRKVYFTGIEAMKKAFAMVLADCHDPDAEAVLAAEKAKVDGWMKDTDSNNLEVREAAVRNLAASDDPRALPHLVKLTKPDLDDATRQAAIQALARKGNYLAITPLTELLGDKKAPIVMRVASALETIQMPDATPPVLAVLKKEKRDRVRGFLLRAAAHSTPENAEVREVTIKSLKGASAQLEPCVLIALGYLNPHDTVVAAVKPLLGDKTVDTRGLAVWVLGCQRTPECKELLKKLLEKEKTPEVQAMAASAQKRCNGEKVEGYETAYYRFFTSSDY